MLTSLMLYFIIPLGLTIGGYLLTHNKTIAIGVFIVTYAVTLVAIDMYNRQEAAKETEGHGYLIPANDPSPENLCLKLEEQRPPDSPFPKIPPNATFFYVGPVMLYWLPDDPNSIEVISLNDKPLLAINRTPKGITIRADLFNSDRKLMARIDGENEFHVVDSKTAYYKRPDQSTLIVYDEEGKEAFYFRFMSPFAARVKGTFLTTSGVPITITDTTIIRTTTQEVLQMSSNCFHNTKRGFVFN